MSYFASTYSIGHAGRALQMNPALEFDGDPRGILWLYERPIPSEQYIMGIDPTEGRTGWNRYARTDDDRSTDNGAIEIVRVGRENSPDVQVAEFAAPIDAFELGYVANIMGRLFAGADEDQCKCILEVYPGPGGMTARQLVELGYTNLWKWEYYAETTPNASNAIGWHATSRSVRDLWVKSSRHINLRNVRINSPFLVEEYADCRMNPEKHYGENVNGHDDRVRAFNLAIWCANGWSMDIERTSEPVRTNVEPNVEWQATDMTLDEIRTQWQSWEDALG